MREGRRRRCIGTWASHQRPPRSAGHGAKSATDPDADGTDSGRGVWPPCGYKVPLGVGQGPLLVHRAMLTPAKVYERAVANALGCGEEGAVYGDRACESKTRRQLYANSLPGLSSPFGSTARLKACIRAIVAGSTFRGMNLRFMIPTPCSPEITPPSSVAAAMMASAAASPRRRSSASRLLNSTLGWRLPSPA